MSTLPENTLVYSVSRLNTEVRQVLEGGFPLIWIEAEISNLSLPRSGHMYFSLKDEHAQTRCAMFRMKRQLLRFLPKDGDRVLARARITLYEARGDFQLVIEHMEPAGEGQLRQAVEALKKRLEQEGLFDPAHKKDLPRIPATVGVITSPSGAVIRDILHVFQRRFPATRIIVYPTLVQGNTAAAEICETLKLADRRHECDLLILARGGGSLEDLMAFNDETLARTIFALDTPIISAVGHETDTSISDYVADRRAPTPSAAAELASPDRQHLLTDLNKSTTRLQTALKRSLLSNRKQIELLEHRLSAVSPQRKLQNQSQKLDYLSLHLQRLMTGKLDKNKARFYQLNNRLHSNSPVNRLRLRQQQLHSLSQRLRTAGPAKLLAPARRQLSQLGDALDKQIRLQLLKRNDKLAYLTGKLNTVSPLSTLSRGYSITHDENGNIVRSAEVVREGQLISTRFADGSVISRVEKPE
jgi:exodeoxyribonuclease VII large subunit